MEQLRESETFNSFCYTLKHNSQHKVPKYFIDGKRKFSIINARLRNLCSNLNYNLFYNHLRPDSICDCLRDGETAEHYFFKCVRYTDQRIILFRDTRDFHPLSVSTLLQGKETLSDEDNSRLFQYVQIYIQSDLLEHIYTK